MGFSNQNALKSFLVGGIIAFLFALVSILFLDAICEASQGLCVLIAFLIQMPAFYISVNFGNSLSNEATTWLFRIVTAVFWFLIGGLVGSIVYHIRKNKK